MSHYAKYIKFEFGTYSRTVKVSQVPSKSNTSTAKAIIKEPCSDIRTTKISTITKLFELYPFLGLILI
uniref:Putative ovule protein n=1 Tax=Solanum chacoense TaxID=4108 RepID=A0A0V0GTE5_SOLCH